MASINELALDNNPLPVPDYDTIPEEYGEFVPPPQPGSYILQLPADLSKVWEVIPYGDNKETRVQAALFGDSSLTLFEADGNKRNFAAWISNSERARGKEKIPVSDMTYLLRALDPSAKPTNNPEFVAEFSKHAGDKFLADVTWGAYCNDSKDAYFTDPETKKSVLCEGTHGCGKNYYQKDIPKVEGQYREHFTCECGANLLVRPKLRNFKSLV